MDRFMIADNPMSGNNQSAIIHTIDPQSIIEVVEGHVDFKMPYKHYVYVNSVGDEELFTFRLHHCFSASFAEDKEAVIDKLLDKAWKWFVAYMEWEDDNIDTDAASIFN